MMRQRWIWRDFSSLDRFRSSGRRAGLIAALLLAVPASADELPAAAFAPHLDDLLVDPQLTALYGTCPADVYAAARSPLAAVAGPFAPIDDAACAAGLGTCLVLCRWAGEPDACASAARTFEAAEEEIGKEPGRRLYALACAVGSASGCTNRAAGVRNDPDDGDPLVALPQPEQEACTARAFALSCANEDAWGCAMSGQSLELGEGITRNSRAAIAAYDKACELSADPEFEACAFARARRNMLPAITQSR